MKCPHCTIAYNAQRQRSFFGSDVDGQWTLEWEQCPECKRFIIWLVNSGKHKTNLVYPKGLSRVPLPESVPEKYKKEYLEACLVLPDSSKASAAISRRCLQAIIREELKIIRHNLSEEIEEVLENRLLPSYLSNNIDAVRSIGNFAAHPIKSTNTGEIIDVEIGEAEWLLDILEGLFDFIFIQPEIMKKKKEDLNIKLKDAGKQEML